MTENGRLAEQVRSPKEIATLARGALDSSQFDQAEVYADQLLAACPDRPNGLMIKGEALAGRGQFDAAFACIDHAIGQFPHEAKLFALGRNLARRHEQNERAVVYARKLAHLDSGDWKNLHFLSSTPLRHAAGQKAICDIGRLEAIGPIDARTHLAKTLALHMVGRDGAATAAAHETFDRFPGDVATLGGLLRVIRNLDAGELPREISTHLISLQPDNVVALQSLLRLAQHKQDWRDAMHWAAALTLAEPGKTQWIVARSKILNEMGRTTEALDELVTAAKGRENDPHLLTAIRITALKADKPEQALKHANMLAKVAPHDDRNNAFLAWIALESADFDLAITISERMVERSPGDGSGWRYLAQALAATRRVDEAMESLERARAVLPDDRRLTRSALALAFHHGHFDKAVGLARELLADQPDDPPTHIMLVQSHMGLGEVEIAREHLFAIGAATSRTPVRKLVQHDRKIEVLRKTTPALLDAWLAAVKNRDQGQGATNRRPTPTVMIQYWSQGVPPADVGFVVDQWRQLLSREKLGEVLLFSRNTARAWIEEFATEFLAPFDKSFHFAMESDIFRIAYASRLPCIYMDIDSWPLENTARVLRYGIEQDNSLLYFRSYQPWIANGFFISKPDCPFIRKLVAQTLTIDLDALPKNHNTIDVSFGPSRFNVVVANLIAASAKRAVSAAGTFGCSKLSLDEGAIHFVHEAAVAAVRPPFTLGYKRTGDYWKRFSAEASNRPAP